ncbi:MAG TPA: hypothetical protein VFS54_08165 [Solirubrobacterales bacterium]|nr:hypothetical protein [Solirubrobacterales bacterium]
MKVLAATTLAALLLALPGAGTAQAVVPSQAAVSLYQFPRVPPTGGAGPLAIDQRGNVWFDQTYEVPPERPGEDPRFPGQIVRMDRQGKIAVVLQKRPSGLAVSGDGSIWFTGFDYIGRIAPDDSFTSFPLPYGEGEDGKVVFKDGPLVVAPDGNVWFSGARGYRDESGRAVGSQPIIGRMTPTGELTEFDLALDSGRPIHLAIGPDGAVWFTDGLTPRVGRVDPLLGVRYLPLPPSMQARGITAGPDGALWFQLSRDEDRAIGRISVTGEVTEFPVPAAVRREEYGGINGIGSITNGPDGRLWFVLEAGAMGRIGPTGRVSKVEIPTRFPEDIAVGPEGSVWYTSAAGPPCLPGDSVCGDGGYYQSGVIGRIDPAPLAVQIETAKAAARAHRVKIRIACIDGRAGESCRGRLRLRAGQGATKRRYALGVDLGRSFSIRLGDKARSKLLRRGKLRIKVIATLAGGGTEVRAFRLRLRTHQAA